VTAVEGTISEPSELFHHKQELQSARAQLEQLTAQLQQSEEDLTHFLYVASHDFTEPLQIVLAYAELLGQRYGDQLGADADRFVAGIRTGAERIRLLIDDLCGYSRLGRRPPEIKEVDCAEIVDEALEGVDERIEETGATVKLDVHATIAGDPSELARLFGSLLDNAIKFRSDAPPEIRVLASRERDGWCFCVRDNGIGIDPAQHERIFEIFQRLHTREEYPGTGVGLAICKKIVDRHGGRIWVESAPGLGSTFCFTIPCAEHER
jgi:light-regulated signal transduction histidine kinase (bacteriophytochrome)